MHGYEDIQEGIVDESDEEKAPFLLEFKDFHEIADRLPSVMISQETNINGQAGNFRSSPSGESLDNFGGGPRTIMVPSNRSLSHHEDQRHPPRSKSPYLLQPEDLPGGAGSMPDQFLTRQTQEPNHQEYSAPPDQQYPQHAEHADGPRRASQSPYQATVQRTAAQAYYFGGLCHGNNLNRPSRVASRRINPLVASAAVRILVSPPQISFPQPPWGSTTVDPRTLPSNHFPIPVGTEVVLPDQRNAGTKRKYRVDYKCYSMTQEKAHRYVENLSKTGVWILPLADTPPSTRLWADQPPHHQRR
jgi:hypothetical protein